MDSGLCNGRQIVSTRLEVLSDEECHWLLEGGSVGRVGVTGGAIPEVLPVNYALLDGDIVFRTGRGTKVHAATSDAPIAFEVDECDPVTLSGWSVLVVGLTEDAECGYLWRENTIQSAAPESLVLKESQCIE